MLANWRNVAQYSAASVIALTAMSWTSSAMADDVPGQEPNFIMIWEASADATSPLSYNPFELGTSLWGTHELGSSDPNVGGGHHRFATGWRTTGGIENNLWSMTWDCVVNEDPFVDATINVTNTSDSVQTFWVHMPLNIFPPILGGTNMSGSVSAVVQASTFGGATLSANGLNPVYQAYIDGNEMLGAAQMWTSGYSLNAGPFGVANDSSSFMNLLGPDANVDIALTLRFDLSPGDSASITGIFQVEPIPAPAGLALLGLAGLVGSRRRRG